MNRKILTLALLALSISAAQAGGINEKQMQQMMEMQKCMANIDQSRLEAMSAKAEAMHGEIKALCDAGKRDKAQSTAIRYGQEMSNSPVMQEMKQCGEMARQMMQQMPMTEKDFENRHVCDSL